MPTPLTQEAANTSELSQLKQRFIDSYTKSGWNESDLSSWDEFSNPDAIKFFQQIFTQGLCVNFQLGALKHLKGWKEYVIHFGKEEYDCGEHSVLKHPNKDLYFDVFGFRSMDDILATYNAQNAPTFGTLMMLT